MAKRADLIAQLEAKYDFLLPVAGRNQQWEDAFDFPADGKSAVCEVEQSVDGMKTIEKHIAYYFDVETGKKGNEQFYVVNPGKADEQAFWIGNKEPKPAQPTEPTFRALVETAKDAKIADGTLEFARVQDIDEVNRRASVQVLRDDGSGNLVEKTIVVYDDNGTLKLKG